MTKKFIVGGCSFTWGHELSDDDEGRTASRKTWAYRLFQSDQSDSEYHCVATPGSGNSGIARRVFNAVSTNEVDKVVVMWSFLSRYDWAMPRHPFLEDKRWATISPWDTDTERGRVYEKLGENEGQMKMWKQRTENLKTSGVKDFAEAIYKYGANMYHEAYMSWKSIIWLQNILEKKKIPYFFTLADNSLFYDYQAHLKDLDPFMIALYSEIDFSKWHSFGERQMGFNQWATLNDYQYATAHPLDKAHEDAVKLMLPTYKKLIGGK
jgi:hypothetical protein|tara:strand:- start:693 stop:1490 length:798 start_codon:yes stop_codon:yes gene_type:complete